MMLSFCQHQLYILFHYLPCQVLTSFCLLQEKRLRVNRGLKKLHERVKKQQEKVEEKVYSSNLTAFHFSISNTSLSEEFPISIEYVVCEYTIQFGNYLEKAREKDIQIYVPYRLHKWHFFVKKVTSFINQKSILAHRTVLRQTQLQEPQKTETNSLTSYNDPIMSNTESTSSARPSSVELETSSKDHAFLFLPVVHQMHVGIILRHLFCLTHCLDLSSTLTQLFS